MKTILFLAFLMVSVCTFAQENKAVSTYYLIRHAEKMAVQPSTMAEAGRLNSENPDPNLSPEGIARATRWAEIFKDVRFDVVYSTNFIRTKKTAQATAEKQGLEIIFYDPKDFNFGDFKTKTYGKTVLVVGHSNTIPGLANQFIGKDKYTNMDDNNYGNLYIVQIFGGQVTDQVLYIK